MEAVSETVKFSFLCNAITVLQYISNEITLLLVRELRFCILSIRTFHNHITVSSTCSESITLLSKIFKWIPSIVAIYVENKKTLQASVVIHLVQVQAVLSSSVCIDTIWSNHCWSVSSIEPEYLGNKQSAWFGIGIVMEYHGYCYNSENLGNFYVTSGSKENKTERDRNILKKLFMWKCVKR